MFELHAYDYHDEEILFLRSHERMTRFGALAWAAHNADKIGADAFRLVKDGRTVFYFDWEMEREEEEIWCL